MEFFQANIIPGEVVVQILAFLIVFFTLRKLAWKPVLDSLESRRAKIRSEFESIEAAKKEIETLKAEYAASLQRIEDQARAKLQEAIDEGRRISREIQEQARLESQATFEKAKENLALEVAKARISLRRDVAGLALDASEKVLKEKMSDDKKQQEKILSIIEDMEKAL